MSEHLAWIEGCQDMREVLARRVEEIQRTFGVPCVVVTAEQIRDTGIPYELGRRYFIPEAE